MTTAIKQLTEDALAAFWEHVVRTFPEAKTGDLSPLTTLNLTRAAEAALREWIDSNVPKSGHPAPASTLAPASDDSSPLPCSLSAAVQGLLAACEDICGLLYRDKHGREHIDLDQYEQAEAACRRAISRAKIARLGVDPRTP